MQRGIDTGNCTESRFCNISSWCPLPQEHVIPDNGMASYGPRCVCILLLTRVVLEI